MRAVLRTGGWLVAALVVLAIVYLAVVRPWHLSRGATKEEAQRSLPGDDLVPKPSFSFTQAITIRASAEQVWPWLVQIGYKRAGWYGWDALHRLIGSAGSLDAARRSANRIIPELQDLEVGDAIYMASPDAPLPGLRVVTLEPNRVLLTLGGDSMSWVWVLDPIDAGTTRLIVRVRQYWEPGLANTLMYGIANDLGSLLMQPKTLRGIRDRAEAAAGR